MGKVCIVTKRGQRSLHRKTGQWELRDLLALMAEGWALFFLGGLFVFLTHLGCASNAVSSSIKVKGEWITTPLYQISSVYYILAAA